MIRSNTPVNFYTSVTINKHLLYKHQIFLIALLLCSFFCKAQFVFTQKNLPENVSILNKAFIADAGLKNFSLRQINSGSAKLKFTQLSGKYGNLGFTNHNYWLRFELKNATNTQLFYYLQTAEPVTDNVNLYLTNNWGETSIQRSGDHISFDKRSIPFRKTFFGIEMKPGEQKQAFLEVKNDGEKNSLPLELISEKSLLEFTYQDQMVMGLFYGVLFVIAVTYFFFYFALRELSFLYYSLYVSFAGLCQFTLDGFYHQFIGKSSSWINLHAVIISAILGSYFFAKYSELILDVKLKNSLIHQLFKLIYFFLGAVFICVLLFPSFLKYAYPIINVLTLSGMLLILSCIVLLLYRKQGIDLFYTCGISILFGCILIAILMNFGIFPSHVTIDNITKPGIGLEVLALSLSMANRIRLLKSKQEELQAVALRKSEEMNDVKSYFLSNMSHELRTPLNVILGLSNLIETETDNLQVKSNCEVIKLTSSGLISSVSDILDFSEIEKGELKLDQSEFSPYNVIDKIRNSTLTAAKEKGLGFEFSTTLTKDVMVMGDSKRLEQIIHNILSNAIKFTEKGYITFKAVTKVSNNQLNLKLSIVDTGIGIPKEKLDSVFDVFSQTEINNKRKFGGFGIGLSVVKALVDLHGGTINLESIDKKGTICIISITYGISTLVQKPVEIYTPKSHDLLGKKILVVEDNKMNQMVLKQIFKRWENVVVSFANDGAEGLEILKKQEIDVILMDLQMPVMDGYEAITAIRNGNAGHHNKNVPIIVLTADVTSATKERVFELTANDYITKPVDQHLLYQKVSALFFLTKAI